MLIGTLEASGMAASMFNPRLNERGVWQMVKRKNKSVAKLVDEAATLLQLLVRLKAANDNG